MKERWSRWMQRLSPPGYPVGRETGGVAVAASVMVLIHLVQFLFRMQEELRWLYDEMGRLIPGAVMAPFSQVTAGYIPAWGVLTLACLALGVVRYTYYDQGSRSIYLMRRLPDRWELWRRTLGWPLVLAVLLALLAAVLLGAFRLGYLWTVPAEAMAE